MTRIACFILWIYTVSTTFAEVKGTVWLFGEKDHSGVKVRFVPQSLTGRLDSVATDSNGSFRINLPGGVYKIIYSKQDYSPIGYDENVLRVVNVNGTLDTVTLYDRAQYVTLTNALSRTLSGDSTYFVNNEIKIDALTINPGARVYFGLNGKLKIKIKLTAKGTASKPIVLDALGSQIPQGNALSWTGLDGNNTADLFLDHCYLGHSVSAITNFYNVQVFNSQLVDNRTVLTNMWDYTTSAIQRIENNEIRNFETLFNGGAGRFTLNCNRLYHSPSPNSGNSFTSRAIRTEITNNEWDGRGEALTLRFPNFAHATTEIIQNNYWHHFSDLQLYFALEDAVYSKVAISNNTFSAEQMLLECQDGDNFTGEVWNNVYDMPLQITALSLNVHHNLFAKSVSPTVVNRPGIGTAVATNDRGHDIDGYYNVLAEPGYWNGHPPYFTSTSATRGSGIDAQQQPANLGCALEGTCLATYIVREPAIVSADSLSIAGKVHHGEGWLSSGLVIGVHTATAKASIARVVDGAFVLNRLRKGEYLLYAVPDPSIRSHIPTYYVNKAEAEASPLLDLEGKIRDIDFHLLPMPTRIKGSARLNGRFSYQDDNTDDTTVYRLPWLDRPAATQVIPIAEFPCKGMPILLRNEQKEIVDWTTTDTLGYFAFDSLSSGTYYVEGQRFEYQTEQEGLVEMPRVGQLGLAFRMTRQDLTAATHSQAQEGKETWVYPSPFSNVLHMRASSETVTVRTLEGVLLYEGKSSTLSTTTWPKGVYLVQSAHQVERLIKY